MLKQWKEKYLVLTVEGSLLVCRDTGSPPDQVVDLQSGCRAVVGGREILDLPRLPPGGRRDSCFALILPQNKFLLLLSDGPEDCRSVFVPLLIRRICVWTQRHTETHKDTYRYTQNSHKNSV